MRKKLDILVDSHLGIIPVIEIDLGVQEKVPFTAKCCCYMKHDDDAKLTLTNKNSSPLALHAQVS